MPQTMPNERLSTWVGERRKRRKKDGIEILNFGNDSVITKNRSRFPFLFSPSHSLPVKKNAAESLIVLYATDGKKDAFLGTLNTRDGDRR